MKTTELSDTDIEILLLGKWRFHAEWEKISIEFKDDMTYRQTRTQMFILSKPKELLTGDKFTGAWYVIDQRLCLVIKAAPESLFNFYLPLFSRVNLGNFIANIMSLFFTEKYEIIQINSSEIVMKDDKQSIFGKKIIRTKQA